MTIDYHCAMCPEIETRFLVVDGFGIQLCWPAERVCQSMGGRQSSRSSTTRWPVTVNVDRLDMGPCNNDKESMQQLVQFIVRSLWIID